MSVLSPPPITRVVGHANVGGKSVPVVWEISWFRYLAQGLFERVGGATGPSTSEAAAEAGGNGGTEELRAALDVVASDIAQHIDHGRISALEALVGELAARIDSIEQGPSL